MRQSFLAALFAVLFVGFCTGQPSTPPGPDSLTELRRQFAQPPAGYSTLPFYVWNGEVTEADIDKYLADYQSQGVKGFFIHPRPGMITPYLSDRWFALIRYTADRAKKLGMQAWLYDENSYPSGFAGGNVPAQMPESYNEGQGLVLRKLAQIDDAMKYKLVLKRSGDAFEDVTARLASEAGKQGDYYAFELAFYDKRAWNGGFSYVDLLRPGVTEKFIEVTMPGYERTLGADLGKTVPGIFTDEPNINPPKRGSIRWTPDLFQQFQKRWGYDLAPRLPALFEETGDWRKVRHDYYATLLQLFIDRWSKPWERYAQSHKILWTGHYWEHGWPSPNDGPDNMAMYAYHDVPSIDMLFNQFDDGVNAQFGNVRAVKELASVANQLGRRRRLSETYGGAGWELRFEDMKRLGDWEYVLGVNMMNQHLSFGTLAGARKYDYPQSFTYHEPWWQNYHVLADYFTRLSLALSSGEQINRMLVLEPTSTAWMYAGPRPNAGMMAAGRAFQAFVTRLEALQTEFDLGCENMVRENGKVDGAQFVIGRRAYDLVVLPPGTENLESSTVQRIEAYLKAGGKVLSFVEPPRRIDGAETPRVAELAARYSVQWKRAESPEALVNPGFTAVSGHLLHQRRTMAGGELLFVTNSSLEQPASAKVNWKGQTATKLDLFTGKTSPYPVRGAAVDISLPPGGSLLLVSGGAAATPTPEKPSQERALAAGPSVVTRLSPNVLQIDYCDLKLAGSAYPGLYFYNAADKVFKHYGFAEGDPWNTAVQYKTNILDRNKFPADSGFEAAFHFDVDAAVDKSTLQAVVERPELWQVSINGNPVKNRPGAWWLDRAFGVYSIGPHVIPGRNTIKLVAKPMSVHNELEPVYVLGNFGVSAQDKGFKLVAPQALSTGSWKEQNLPFYYQAVSYSKEVKANGNSGRTRVRLGKWNGTLAEVLVNSKPAGIIAWKPYELDITDSLKPGANRVEVVVYGSLKNLLGPHHGKINRGLTSPWSFRSAPDQMPPGAAYDMESYGLQEDFTVIK